MKVNVKCLITVMAVALTGVLSSQAQTVDQTAAAAEQRSFSADPIRDLNLTPEQREQIRTIREQNRSERAAINQNVREAHRALNEALDSDVPDQVLVEQRIQQVSTAQAAAMRMRIMTEVKIRQVLTAEQRTKLKALRQRAHELRDRRVPGTEERRRRLEQRTLRLQERRNRIRSPRAESQNQPQEW